jgi:hypothetical protein
MILLILFYRRDNIWEGIRTTIATTTGDLDATNASIILLEGEGEGDAEGDAGAGAVGVQILCVLYLS